MAGPKLGRQANLLYPISIGHRIDDITTALISMIKYRGRNGLPSKDKTDEHRHWWLAHFGEFLTSYNAVNPLRPLERDHLLYVMLARCLPELEEIKGGTASLELMRLVLCSSNGDRDRNYVDWRAECSLKIFTFFKMIFSGKREENRTDFPLPDEPPLRLRKLARLGVFGAYLLMAQGQTRSYTGTVVIPVLDTRDLDSRKLME